MTFPDVSTHNIGRTYSGAAHFFKVIIETQTCVINPQLSFNIVLQSFMWSSFHK